MSSGLRIAATIAAKAPEQYAHLHEASKAVGVSDVLQAPKKCINQAVLSQNLP